MAQISGKESVLIVKAEDHKYLFSSISNGSPWWKNPSLTCRAIPQIYFKAWPVSLLAALRNPTQKNKDICFLEKNYKFVPRIYYG